MIGSFQHAFFLTCAMSVALTALAQKTDTKFDGQYNFSQHKRYKWRENRLMTRQNPDTNEVMDLKIVKAANQMLASKGFVEVQDKPDFYVYYDGGGEAQIGAGGANLAGSGPATSADLAPSYGLGNGPALAPSTWLKLKGQIEFHIVDAGSQKPVWETTYSKTFRDPDKALRNMDKEVKELVSKSFKDFPPKSKS
jgi:Domain of unknown function (DUF4136)